MTADPLERIRKLMTLALGEATPAEEARTAAMLAVRLIQKLSDESPDGRLPAVSRPTRPGAEARPRDSEAAQKRWREAWERAADQQIRYIRYTQEWAERTREAEAYVRAERAFEEAARRYREGKK